MKSKFFILITYCFFLLALVIFIQDASAKNHISWQQKEISITAFPGIINATTSFFASDVDLDNAEIFIVPELSKYISVNPSRFASITAGKPNQLTLITTISSDSSLGDFEGTLHIRVGKRTYPEVLKVRLSIKKPTTFEIPYDNIIYPAEERVYSDPVSGGSFVKDELLIGFKFDTSEERIKKIVNSINGAFLSGDNDLKIFTIQVAVATTDLDILIQQLENFPEVTFASHSWLDQAQSIPKYPNDSKFDSWDENNPSGNNWGQEFIKLPSAWNIETGTPLIQIAVVDGGFQLDHEDLVINLNTDIKTAVPNVVDRHGTEVAGVLGAVGNNGIGIAGALWNTKIQPYGILIDPENPNWIYTPVALVSMKLAIKQNAQVINYSWGATLKTIEDVIERNKAFKQVIYFAKELTPPREVLFVFAAGNDKEDFVYQSPSSLSLDSDPFIQNRVISVAGNDYNDLWWPWWEPWWGSNYGRVNVAAPAKGIFSTIHNNDYAFDTGTSMSAPFVTGLAGLILSKVQEMNLNLSAELVKNYILWGAQKGGKYVHGPDNVNIPIINAYESLNLLVSPPTPSILSSSDITPTSAKISWTKNEDPDFQGYRLYRIIIIDGVPQVTLAAAISDQNQTSFIDTNLTPDTRYYYRLRTYDQAGLFSRSDLISFITPSLPFIVPFANITIDGDISDWQNIQPAHIDATGDSLGTLPGTDFTNFYLARDNEYLYFRIDFANGLPPEGANILYHIGLDMPPRDGRPTPGDGSITFWHPQSRDQVTVYKILENESYNDLAALGSSSIEARARLDFIGNPDNFFTGVSVNENGQWVDWQDIHNTLFEARIIW